MIKISWPREVLYLFFLLLPIAMESARYDGFFSKNLGIPLSIILPLVILTIFFYLRIKIKKQTLLQRFLWITLCTSILLILAAWISEAANLLTYQNFSYSSFRISPKVLAKNGAVIFLTTLALFVLSGFYRQFLYLATSAFLSLFAVDKLNLYAFSNSDFNLFDGAISYLGHYYYAQGFTPYKDFGFPYPLARLLLLGEIISFVSILQRDFIFSLLTLGLFATLAFLLFKIKAADKAYLLIPAIIALFSISIFDVPYDPFFIPLSFIYFAFGAKYLQSPQKKPPLWFLFLPVLLWFSRWDFSFLILLYEVAFFLIFTLAKKKFNKRLFLYKLKGHLLGLISIFLYLLWISAFKEAFMFILAIHKKAMTYRALPLPEPSAIFSQDNLFFLSLLILTLLSLSILFEKKDKIEKIYILLFPVVFLPYALGRSDWPHFLPLYKATIFTLVLAAVMKIISEKKAIAFLLFSILPIYTLIYTKTPKFLPYQKEKTQSQINKLISDCREKTTNLEYKSIFVTKDDYTGYTGVSNSALYLINPAVAPAGKFIHEEVGVHSDCQYGQLITSYLDQAPKPILTFVQISDEKKKSPPSCGKIENWLKKKKYQEIGVCTSDSKEYMIRIYE